MIRRYLASACLMAVAGCVAYAQVSAPSFEVASVKLNAEKFRSERRFYLDPQGLDIKDAPLLYIIRQAYQRPISRIVYPSRMTDLLRDAFDIAARSSPHTRSENMLMLQSLLAERFKLAVHHESRNDSLYNLVVAKSGPKLAKSNAEFEGQIPQMGLDWIEGKGVPLSRLCLLLSSRLQREVVDRTGMTGLYDFRLKIDILELEGGPTGKSAGEFWSSSSIFSDIQHQLGLKLEGDRGPVDYLIIDQVERPSEN